MLPTAPVVPRIDVVIIIAFMESIESHEVTKPCLLKWPELSNYPSMSCSYLTPKN